MFEDFRKQAEESDFPDEGSDAELRIETIPHKDELFLGMTPIQRFIIALLLLIIFVILGVLFLMVTERIVLPFYN